MTGKAALRLALILLILPLETVAQTTLPQESNWMTEIDRLVGTYLVAPLAKVLFFDFGTKQWLGTSVPFVVLWLLAGAIFFTIRMGFINIRGFWHAICVTKGDYDDPEHSGEVTHFQALASALSATVGLGNIAGVAIAVGAGGPGAIFWLIVAGLLGMSSKFTECSLGMLYRKVDRDGTVSGGPMHYLKDGLQELGYGKLGAFLAGLFATLCFSASFGGGCAFQVVQSMGAISQQIPTLKQYPWIYGLLMVVLVGVVIIGGIKRIAATAEKIVPLMCGLYVLVSIFIILSNISRVPEMIFLILKGAFTPDAAYGGFLGVMVIGIRRAVFSNEAGIGSASIAHSAAKTEEPISEGIVALLEPFIDTVVVCTMTGLVIVITGVYNDPQYADLVKNNNGAALTAAAFRSTVSWFPWILSAAVFLFAYSTMISWSYYGERCFSYLFGKQYSIVYKLMFIVAVFLGSIVTATNILEFSDLMILAMSVPNILGLVLLSGKVRSELDKYWQKYLSGALELRKGA
ncbi:MAG: alanine/glycine:cation symporter family protein [Acidobacteriota bacterium]|nr:alanine:cation symporter family protein [Blastocatellia bacterium]MDW8411062.1 alanine/glycine:cation symporter family protein [Acidobacteriota bacterium]